MGAYVAEQTIKAMNRKGVLVKDARILILGFTFKENCPDIRNTKVIDIIHTFQEYTQNITVFDPWADPERVLREYDARVTGNLPEGPFDAIVLAVAHKDFETLDVRKLVREGGVVYDVKGVLPRDLVDARL